MHVCVCMCGAIMDFKEKLLDKEVKAMGCHSWE